jgi:hypothetical protein
MYTTFIGLKTQEQKDALEKICQDIHQKDKTFNFTIKPPSKPGSKYLFLLMVQSPNFDTAHKRGCWLIAKTNIPGLLYWVK